MKKTLNEYLNENVDIQLSIINSKKKIKLEKQLITENINEKDPFLILLEEAEKEEKYYHDMLVNILTEMNDKIDILWAEFLKRNEVKEYEPVRPIELPNFLNKHRTNKNYLVDSRGEQIIANILDDLQIPFQIGLYIKEYKINIDFVLLYEPNTIIEYWGWKNDNEYDLRRKEKIEIYKKLQLILIDIEADEVNNIPKLKNRLADIFLKTKVIG